MIKQLEETGRFCIFTDNPVSYKVMKNIHLVIFLLVSHGLCAQTMEERYSLDFHDISWEEYSLMSYFYIDTSQTVNGKHPFQITSMKKHSMNTRQDSTLYRIDRRFRVARKDPSWFRYWQDIVLPDFDKRSKVQLTLNSKCHLIQNIYLKVTCFDGKEKVIHTDSVNINKSEWGEDTLSFTLNNTRVMSIEIAGNTDFTMDEVIFWADRLKIRINETDFNSYVERETGMTAGQRRHVHPLSLDDVHSYSGIKDFRHRQIIGIGESMHGSENMTWAALQFLKSLILYNRCKVVLFETYMDLCLKWDLYTQGISPESTLEEIIEEIKMGINSGDPYRDFFIWLRKYNTGRSDKVRIFGMDGTYISFPFIADYLHTLQNSGKNIKSLSEIQQNTKNLVGDFDKINEIIRTDRTVRQCISDRDYAYFMYVINTIQDRKLLTLEQSMALFNEREVQMSAAIDTVMSLYLDKKDRAVIYAHSTHVNKVEDIKRNRKSMGAYIHEKHGNQYFCISLQAGMGTHTQDSTHMLSTFVADTLDYPENNSFEKFCMNAEPDYFYYPSRALPSNLHTLRLITRGNKGDLRQFKFLDLKNRFDAYIFIRYSIPLQDVNVNHTLSSNSNFIKKIENRVRNRTQ